MIDFRTPTEAEHGQIATALLRAGLTLPDRLAVSVERQGRFTIALANRTGVSVWTEANGYHILGRPGDDPDDLIRELEAAYADKTRDNRVEFES